MTQDEVLELLHRATQATQYEAMRQALKWSKDCRYLSRGKVEAARQVIALAEQVNLPELLLGVALLMVPGDWNGDASFGKGLNRSVLFSPTFVSHGDEAPVEAEHELPSMALAICAVTARP